ncbi:hypothetical protein ACIRFH_02880 [Streptomyces sp. NPDC093586]|uniref:hypothetical protein n=1 Tax=Streptomyces sp. NPDC093586 TaxID=3366042 RepID=UPI00381F7587
MAAKARKKPRPVVSGLVVLVLVAVSGHLTLELREREGTGVTEVVDAGVLDGTRGIGGAPGDEGGESWFRLENPARSVLRDADGRVRAVLTDGARTATLTGPARTFEEPAPASSGVSTTDWVRLMPEPWRKGAEKEKWFTQWYARYKDSEEDDLFAAVFRYAAGAPREKDGRGVVRAGGGLPRTADAVARSEEGVDVLPLTGVSPDHRPSAIDRLQPGDRVFFELDPRSEGRLDHMGMVLGYDAEGHLLFVSGREGLDGPAVGGPGGVFRLDGDGHYARALRSAKRL